MSKIAILQPNGLICLYSTVAECPVKWNLTDEQYLEYRVNEAKETARTNISYMRSECNTFNFECMKEAWKHNRMTTESYEEILKEMGDEP